MPLIANILKPRGKGTPKMEEGTYASLPDTTTEIAHVLGRTPLAVFLTPRSTAVIGYALEAARSATSITVRANVSGVDIEWSAVG